MSYSGIECHKCGRNVLDCRKTHEREDIVAEARAEIVAKLRERAKRTAAVAGENWAIDTGPLEAAAEFDLAVADWIEAGCPS